jgi:hypothetical protein
MKTIISLFTFIFITISFYAQQYPPNTVWHPVEPDEVAKPAYLTPYIDVAHDIKVTRVTDATVFGYPDGVGELRGPYSKTQAWNSDMTKIAVGFNSILNADDYTFYKTLYSLIPSGGLNDGKWSHINSDIRYFCNNDKFYRINIETEVLEELHTFGVAETRIGPFEGNISLNDKYVVITDNTGFQAYLYDIELDVIISQKTFVNNGFDWATITPWSNYIAVSNRNTGVVELYDLNFNYIRNLSDNHQHADFGIDSDGNEVLVQVSPVSMTRLADGVVTDLLPEALVCGNYTFNPNVGGHISCRNVNFTGWALVSTPNSGPCTNGIGYYYITEVFAVKLDGSGTIKHYGYSYNNNYSSTASFSPDGSKVIFSSNWNLFETNNDTSINAYIAEYNNVLSVDDLSNPIYLVCYPNPTNNILNIKTNIKNIENVEIYNFLGMKIFDKSYQNTIDVTNFSPGVYFFNLITNNKKYVKKIVIKEGFSLI